MGNRRGPAPRLTVVALEGAEMTHDRVTAAVRAFEDAMADGHVSVAEQQMCWRAISEAMAAARETVGRAERADIAQLAAVNMLSGSVSDYTARRMTAAGMEPLDAA